MIVDNGRLIVRRADGTPSDGREPLDVEALFRELAPDDRLDESLPAGVEIGHVHLYGASLENLLHFYHHVLGFKPGLVVPGIRMADVSPTIEMPHVIAFNTWQGEGASPPPAGSLGLRYFTIVLPNRSQLEQVAERVRKAGVSVEQTQNGLLIHDPSQIGIILTAQP